MARATEKETTIPLPDDGPNYDEPPVAPPGDVVGYTVAGRPITERPAMVGPHQQRAMAAALRDHGLTTDAAVYAYLSAATGREIESRKELTTSEAARIIRDLIDNPPKPGGLAKALIAVQRELPFVAKTKTATVPTKAGGQYKYTYADLADVTEAALPLLTKHGLAFTCLPRAVDGRGYELVGVLLHESGERVEGALPLYGNDPQQLGGALTYHRRYLLGCMIGLVTDDDADARQVGSDVTHAQPMTPPPVDDDLVDKGTADLLMMVGDYADRANKTFTDYTAAWRNTFSPPLSVPDLDDLPAETVAAAIMGIRAHMGGAS